MAYNRTMRLLSCPLPGPLASPLRVLAFATLVFLPGCATTVITPEVAEGEAVSVFILDHGRHASLLLPAATGGSVRYSYGDWNYYALRRTGLGDGMRALLGASDATLGRQRLPGIAPDPTTVQVQLQRRLAVKLIAAHEIRVPSLRAEALHQHLEEKFRRGARVRQTRWPGDDTDFVAHPREYSFTHNSNFMIGHWLTALGCEVHGRPVLSRWRIQAPSPAQR